MNIFELAKLTYPIGGVVGGAMAVPSNSAWLFAAIPVGLVCGIGCYRGLMLLAIGRYDKDPDMPGWRMAAIFGISLFAPVIGWAFSYGLVGFLFRILA